MQLFVLFSIVQLISGQTQYFFTNARMGYNEAVNYCNGLEMDLIKIDSYEQNIKAHNFSSEVRSGAFWISGSDVAEETRWIDTDNNEMNYKNWAHDQPNGGRHENCIVGNVYSYGTWDDANCGLDFSVICQTSERNPKKLSYNIGSYKMTYNEAIWYCEGIGMDLVIINNATKNMAVFELARKNGFGSYWINGNDIQRETHWVDLYNQRLNFTNWHYSRPNGGRRSNCVQGGLYGIWIDVDCDNRTNVICEVKQYPWLSKANDGSSITTSPQRRESPNFIISNYSMSYDSATRFCNNYRMEIFTVNNHTLFTWEQEVNFRRLLIPGESYWINVAPDFTSSPYVNSNQLYRYWSSCAYAWNSFSMSYIGSKQCHESSKVICIIRGSGLW